MILSKKTNNKGADQTEQMRRVVYASVVRELPKTGFLTSRPNFVAHLRWAIRISQWSLCVVCRHQQFALNDNSFYTTLLILAKLHRNVPRLVNLYTNLIHSKNMAARVGYKNNWASA